MRNRQQERPLAAHSWATLHRLLGAGTQLHDAPKGAWFSRWSAQALRERESHGTPDFGRPASCATGQSKQLVSLLCRRAFASLVLTSCFSFTYSATVLSACTCSQESCIGGPNCPCLRTPDSRERLGRIGCCFRASVNGPKDNVVAQNATSVTLALVQFPQDHRSGCWQRSCSTSCSFAHLAACRSTGSGVSVLHSEATF